MNGLACPVPALDGERILLAHGGGGRRTQELLDTVFLPAFGDPALEARGDAAVLAGVERMAFTTDSFVVRPLFFPGGDIGRLAVFGTVNDLAMAGARPLYLTAGFILEEGLPLETLRRVAASMARAAKESGVRLVAGDTKVVERGRADGLYVTTSGVGALESDKSPGPSGARPGDAVIVSGDLGRHGVAVLAAREGLEFEVDVVSDCADLWPSVRALLASGADVHALRDLTRGGLASAANEIAQASGAGIVLEEEALPVGGPVRAACEVLGLDPLSVANEGRFAVFIPEAQAKAALACLRREAPDACRVGTVRAGEPLVVVRTALGAERIVDMPSGELLPRIC